MIFALPQFLLGGENLPATHWYWRPPEIPLIGGPRWVAVDEARENWDNWFGGHLRGAPERLSYPIDEIPAEGELIWADLGGMRRWHIGVDTFEEFTRTVAEFNKDGDIAGGHVVDIDGGQAKSLLRALVSEARTLVELPQVIEAGAWFLQIPPRAEDEEGDEWDDSAITDDDEEE